MVLISFNHFKIPKKVDEMPTLDHFGKGIPSKAITVPGRTFFGHAATDFAATIHVGTIQQQIPDLKRSKMTSFPSKNGAKYGWTQWTQEK